MKTWTGLGLVNGNWVKVEESVSAGDLLVFTERKVNWLERFLRRLFRRPIHRYYAKGWTPVK